MRNSKIGSVLTYSQNFSLFWPFLEKMADFSKPSKNRHRQMVAAVMMIVTDGGGCDDDSDRW